MTPTKTADRPAPTDQLPMGAPLPAELQITPPAAPAVEQTYAVLPIDAIEVNPDNPRSDLGEYYAYLKTLGYEPSPWEQAQLAEAAERAKEAGGG